MLTEDHSKRELNIAKPKMINTIEFYWFSIGWLFQAPSFSVCYLIFCLAVVAAVVLRAVV